MVLKKLLKRAAEARSGPVLALDGVSNQRYSRVARALGGRHLVLDSRSAVEREAASAAEALGSETRCLTVSLRRSGSAHHALCELLAGRFPSGPPPHHFLDPLEAILGNEAACSLTACLWAVARRYSLFTAGAVLDHEALFRHPAGRGLLSNARAFLLMKMAPEPAAGLASKIPLAFDAAGLAPKDLARLDRGEGFYVRMPGRASRPKAQPLYVDCKAEELRLFNTDPTLDDQIRREEHEDDRAPEGAIGRARAGAARGRPRGRTAPRTK